MLGRDGSNCKRQYTLPLGSNSVCLRVPVVRIERFSPSSACKLLCAHGQYLFWRAFYINRGMSIVVVMQCRHKAVFRVKWNGIGAGPIPMSFIAINSGFSGKCQQGALHWIALYLP
ncbi:hypothetical protein D3C77_417100 [compost metagenome]